MSHARLTQHIIEVLQGMSEAGARISQDVVEVLQAYTVGAAPSGSFGAAVSQDVVEVLQAAVMGVRVSQDVVEVLFQDGTEGGGSGGVHTFGFAV